MDRRTWVSATATRNYAMNDPLLDWLHYHGESKGFKPDNEYTDYDERTDFRLFIMNQGNRFESAVANHISELYPIYRAREPRESSADDKVFSKTLDAINEGHPVIYQAVLRDEQTQTYGIADFLIRSDIFGQLFNRYKTDETTKNTASLLHDEPWHYRALDAKFSTLRFSAAGNLLTSGSAWAYMIQLYIYNRALGNMQGYTSPNAYLLGRKWSQTARSQTLRGVNFMDRLGEVSMDYFSDSKGTLENAVANACEWIRTVRSNGHLWEIYPEPSIPQLRPNMSSTADQPWHHAKTEINQELKDLTTLWGVGVDRRNAANREGILKWNQDGLNAEDLGVKSKKSANTLQAILDINNTHSESVLPAHIETPDQVWRSPQKVEFYVDFETVSDLKDDFTNAPESGGTPLIFMIGCGHLENDKWVWKCFTTDRLTEDAEGVIIDQWMDHMYEVQNRIDPAGYTPIVYHWSHAEVSTFDSAFNSAKNRHVDKEWPTLNWFDFLQEVIKKEPVVVKGAFGFGLKAIAGSLNKKGLIRTSWDAGPTDGLGAMVGAWWADDEAKSKGIAMNDIPMVQEISQYNEVDCKVMMEIIEYLRKNH